MFVSSKMYLYQTTWHFGFFRNSVLLGAILLGEPGRFRVLSDLEGLIYTCYIAIDYYKILHKPPWIFDRLYDLTCEQKVINACLQFFSY